MASFIGSVPPALRLLLAIAVFVGITVLMARVFRAQILQLNGRDEIAKDERKRIQEETGETQPPLPPETSNLSGRILGLISTAFVFLLAFTLGNFWGDTRDASSAAQAEAADWLRASAVARSLPDTPQREALRQALADYRTNLEQVQWPMMQRGDSAGALSAQIAISTQLSSALQQAEAAGGGKTPQWGILSSSVGDMLEQARDRVNAIPNRAAPGAVAIIFVLGIANLAMTTVFQPARLGTNTFLLGLMAAITATLLFVVVEASNPYVGAVSVTFPSVSAG